MKQNIFSFLTPVFVLVVLFSACHHKAKESKDSVYSRHLQKHIDLTIISTAAPKEKSLYNLLLLNDGQDIDQLDIKKIIDSLNKNDLLQPLLVVAVNAFDRIQEYGVAGYPDYQNNGVSADKYGEFIDNELLPFIKKRTGIKIFSSVTIAGCSLGGLSAFDVAWDHADKIDKVGIFSGSFWYRDKNSKDPSYSDDKDRLIINKIRSSGKRPHLKYWFYAGDKEETSDRDKDGVIDVVDDTKDLIDVLKNKNIPPADITFIEDPTGVHEYTSWKHMLPQFLLWADGK